MIHLTELPEKYPYPYRRLLQNGEHKTFAVTENNRTLIKALTGTDRLANRITGQSQGYFALLNADNAENRPDAAQLLFTEIRAFQAALGNTRFIGPINPDGTAFNTGIMTEGFSHKKELLNPHNPPYCDALLRASNLTPIKRFLGYQIALETLSSKRFAEAAERACKRGNISIDTINLRRGKQDYRRLYEAADSYAHLSLDAFSEQLDLIKPFLHKNLLLIAAAPQGEPAGMIMTLYDKHTNAYRIATLHVKENFRKTPVALCLFGELTKRLIELNAHNLTASVIDETNLASRACIENAGGIAVRAWQVYQGDCQKQKSIPK